MHADQPIICEACRVAFITTLKDTKQSAPLMKAWWCEHNLALAVCLVQNGFIARWAIEGPMDPEDAEEYKQQLEASGVFPTARN